MKQCNNHCNQSWCCSGETYLDTKERYTKDSIVFSRLKGLQIFEWTHYMVVVRYKCPCICLDNGCCSLGEVGLKPKGCSEFPTAKCDGMVLTERCKYFDKDKHVSFEGLKKYEPTK